MKRILAYILIFTALASIFTLSVNAMDVSDSSSPTASYSIPYSLTIKTSTGLTIFDGDSGLIYTPSYLTASGSNSVVNALYYGSSLLVRKATTLADKSMVNGNGYIRYYSEYTNITTDTYDVEIYFPFVTLDDLTKMKFLFNGADVTADYVYTRLEIDSYVEGTSGGAFKKVTIDVSDDLLDFGGYTDYQFDGEIFTPQFYNYVKAQLPDPDNYGQIWLRDLKVFFSVDNPTDKIQYSVRTDYTTSYPLDFEYNRTIYVPNDYVTVDSNIVSWLGDCVDAIFSTEIFPNVTISTLLWAVLGVGIAVMFIKFFAGG